MPSIKMKSKSTPENLKEKCGLHVCQKSHMISKRPLHARIIDNDDNFRSSTRTDEVASFHKDACNIVRDEDNNDELFNAEDPEVQKKSPSKEISTTCEMESAPAPSSSSMETIFSPIHELIDDPSDLLFYDYGGNNDLYVPQLESEDSDDSSKGSCKYQNSSASGVYISDMILSGLPLEGDSIYDDSTYNNFVHDYKWNEEPSTFPDNFMVMPFLEDTVSLGYSLDNRSCGETLIASNDSSFYQAIHQVRPCVQESDVDYTTPDSDKIDCFDPHMFIKSIPELPDAASCPLPIFLSSQTQKEKSITLVLDLDETLVHSTLESWDDADFTFSVYFNMKEHTVYVKQRPHLSTFLERVAEMFEIVIFTASQSIYAKQLLDILDPEEKLISRRAYRESCTFLDGSYTKDLTVLGVDLAKVVIIDNSPQVFRLQVNNGIPIKSWFDDPSDSALLSLLPFLETLANADDVRPIIAERFGNKE
ncbi:hypothetical protein Leryth_016059 [Lithospermum erythrorhizon]|nr:hypothetical protein Leryth_016059 [Lithospermum erythrorhizon]